MRIRIISLALILCSLTCSLYADVPYVLKGLSESADVSAVNDNFSQLQIELEALRNQDVAIAVTTSSLRQGLVDVGITTATLEANKVPYTGATGNIDLNAKSIENVNRAGVTHLSAATIRSSGTMILGTAGTGSNLQIIAEGNGINITDGSSGKILFLHANNASVDIGANSASTPLKFYSNAQVGMTLTGDNLQIDGDVNISSRPYAYLQWDLHASSRTILLADTYEVAAGTSALVYGVWFDKYGEAGARYRGPNTHAMNISIGGCMRTDSAGAHVPHIQIYKNGVALDGYVVSPYLANQSKDTILAFPMIIEMATDDYIEVFLKTSSGADLFIDHLHLVIDPID